MPEEPKPLATVPRAELQTTAEVHRILELAVNKDLDIEKLQALMEMRRDVRREEAAREFAAAFSDFQRLCPSIPRTSTASITTKSGGRYAYSYAELDEIAQNVNTQLGQHGFSYYWDVDTTDTHVEVTCHLEHAAGHSRTSNCRLPIESASTGMSKPQQVASVTTAAKRHSLSGVLGLTTTDPDTDTNPPPSTERITDEQIEQLNNKIVAIRDDAGGIFNMAGFLGYMQVESLAAITDFGKAWKMLEAKHRQVKTQP